MLRCHSLQQRISPSHFNRSLIRASGNLVVKKRLLSSSVRQPSQSTPQKPSRPFGQAYEPKLVETGWYEWWESQGFFGSNPQGRALIQTKPTFNMITPPPNVTGSLHIGHALTFSLEDAVVRWRRMCGYDVSWIPGTDHAGIGTQSVVERQLMKDRQLSRHDLGREAFVEEIWKWREHYGNRIIEQIRKIGASVDWDKTYFTMDESRSKAVQNAFIKLYEDGLIYRDSRLVNWCCELETVISDIEVDYHEITGQTFKSLPGRSEGVEFGVLHKFAYQVVDPSGIDELVVATTRIETMLGDCAVAIHPEDARYKSLHGKSVIHPLTKKKIPIICDPQLVDMEFGTGVVKITPAHDQNDYECGRRHGLPIVSIFDKSGRLNEKCGVKELEGIDRFEARKYVVEKLQELNVYRGKETDHPMRLAVCSRSGDVIEPLIQPQWYIKCSGLADNVAKYVDQGDIVTHPVHHRNELNRWLNNIQDWCVSRQLWWGHRIPAYQIRLADSHEDFWVVARDNNELHANIMKELSNRNLPDNTPYKAHQDEDVFDTWFSSALLPLSASGWTGPGTKAQRYPLSVMETGLDILFFWVSRMAMLCTHLDGQPPFKDIFLHAMVRDAQGRKMSKSLGNVIDPLHVIHGVDLDTLKEAVRTGNLAPSEVERSIKNLEVEYPNGIQSCGADSLRFALVSYTQQTRQINLDINNVVSTTHFGNKMWNLFKYGLNRIQMMDTKLSTSLVDRLPKAEELASMPLVNRYILSRLATAVMASQAGFEKFRLHEATDASRRFIIEDLCDVYVEFSKSMLKDSQSATSLSTLNILSACMDVGLRLTHPFMPFVTEELWHHYKEHHEDREQYSSPPSLMLESFPAVDQFAQYKDENVESGFQTVLSIIHASRSLRQSNRVSIAKELPFKIWYSDTDADTHHGELQKYVGDIKDFIRASSLEVLTSDANGDYEPTEPVAMKIISPNLKVFVPMKDILRSQPQSDEKSLRARIAKLEKKLTKTDRELERLGNQIQQSSYESATPIEIQQKNK
ncbi:hypothetical protein INT44_002420 [Umbelopsis vinacea]|uniref:valine--tRNA ligase n=1 Tax=Umbelopsis vinacea TaxID=44442 RepID=A0A8H7Q472_9FUNG|nr:hypothetical protein INT44_002420 [Umbelopsis vinacea]